MKAIYLDKKGTADDLVFGDIATPVTGRGEMLVKVFAAAVTPTELLWFPTFALPSGKPRAFPTVLGHEFSGVVESVADDAAGFAAGDPVYGLNDWFINGAQAEYCVVAAAGLSRKPESLSHAEASVVPISALTVWQGLYEKADLKRDQRVLIHGGAGAVGAFAVQLAHRRGAHVIATASESNLDFVRSLGADVAIDYRKIRIEDMARDMDVVFDTVGGETLDRSWSVLKPSGKMVTVATRSEGSTDQRTKDAFMIVRADGAQLAQIGKLIDAGELRVFVEQTFPLKDARQAYARAQQGKLRGKIALRVVE